MSYDELLFLNLLVSKTDLNAMAPGLDLSHLPLAQQKARQLECAVF